jgi:hypothetical protein
VRTEEAQPIFAATHKMVILKRRGRACLFSSERTDLSALESIPCRGRGDMAWGEDGAERVPPIRREGEAVLRKCRLVSSQKAGLSLCGSDASLSDLPSVFAEKTAGRAAFWKWVWPPRPAFEFSKRDYLPLRVFFPMRIRPQESGWRKTTDLCPELTN